MADPVVMTPEQLTKAINEAITNSPTLASFTKSIEEIKQLSAKANQKQLFPEGYDPSGENQSFSGSHVDFSDVSIFGQTKNASEALSQGGIFKRISPAMSLFAKYLQHGLKCAVSGVHTPFDQLKELQEANIKQFKSFYKDAPAGQVGLNTDGSASGSQSGFLVPTEFPAIMIEIAAQISGIANACWRVPMTTNDMYLPRLDITNSDIIGGNFTLDNAVQQGGATAGTAIARQGISTSKVRIKAGRLTNLIVLANELIEDAPINILNFVSALMVRKYAYILQYMILRGRGYAGYNSNGLSTDEPLGILSGVTTDLITKIARTKLGTVVYDDLVNLRAAVKPELRWPEMYFITNGDAEGALRKQKDEASRPIFWESWTSQNQTPITQPMLMGHKLFLSSNMPALGAAGDVLFANLGNYYLGVRNEMQIEISRERYFDTYETAVRFTSRVGGNVGTPVAFASLLATV